MQYYRNSELAKIYSVSRRTVSTWVKSVHDGKLDIQLFEKNGKFFIANTVKNMTTIEQLVAHGKKYKNSRGQKNIKPLPEFYKTFSRKQVFDIINSIDVHREIPRQYNYVSKGAKDWDNYAYSLWQEKTPNTIIHAIELLRSDLDNIDRLLAGRKQVNIVDIGPGNCLPIKELMTHFIYETDVFARYIAIDVSEAMLKIANSNLKKWFGEQIKFEGHIRDITHDRFDDIVANHSLSENPDDTANLILFLGGTVSNFRSPDDALRTICNSMGRNDILICSNKLDSELSRRTFNFNRDSEEIQRLQPQYKFLVDLLNIDESLYEVKSGFEEVERYRFLRIKLKVAISLTFAFEEGKRKINIEKGEELLIWRAWHQTTFEFMVQFERTGFVLLQASTSQDRDYILTTTAVDMVSHKLLAPRPK